MYQFVAFWQKDHWVAGLTDRSLMQSGSTLEKAVTGLRALIKPSSREWNRRLPHPYEGCGLKGNERPYSSAYEIIDDGGERWPTEPSKTSRYTGTFSQFQVLAAAWHECSGEDQQTVLSDLLRRAEGLDSKDLSVTLFRLVAVMQNLPKP